MKNLYGLLLLVGVFLCDGAVAQEFSAGAASAVVGVELRGDTVIYRMVPGRNNQVEDQSGIRYRLRPVKEFDGPRHALSLGIGAFPASGARPIIPGITSCNPYSNTFEGVHSYYEGSLRMTGAIVATYTYRPRRWLEVGFTLSYAGFYRNLYYSSDGSTAQLERDHFFTLMPLVRFSWLNRRSVRIYSEFQLGWQLGFEKWYFSEYSSYNYLAAQFTPFGISVGRRFFGYAELGIGMRGLFSAGVGYRFGTPRK